MLQEGIRLQHVERDTTVPMYRTNIACTPAGRFKGTMVVSMRPLSPADAIRAVQITSRFPAVHGAPVHLGLPETIGIKDIMRPDYGADIQSLLFDGADSLVRADVAATVKERLSILVPRATIKSVTLITEPTELSIRGIDSDGRNVVLIDVLYATRLIEYSLAVVVQNGETSG